MEEVKSYKHTIKSEGHTINCTVFEPPQPKYLLVIAPAMGVFQKFYKPIASYFAANSYTVITFDYYGMVHGTAEKEVKNLSYAGFGTIDINAVINFAMDEFSDKPLFFLGHSVAGQVFPLAACANKIEVAYFVASQSVSQEYWSGVYRLGIAVFWNLVIPFFVGILGYLPGFAYGGKHKLSARIARDWARHAKTRDGLMGSSAVFRKAYQNLQVPTMFISLENDDILAPKAAVKALMDSYGTADKKHEHLKSEFFNLGKLGHFDFFRSGSKKLWVKVSEWFEVRRGL